MILDTTLLGRQNEYRDKAYAQYIAEKTNGEFIDEEFSDKFGSYWVVIWRYGHGKGKEHLRLG